MPSSATPLHCDIFCNVIDNYGDIGVCWRLARQLACEHRFAVRLWVDELPVFQRICPDIDLQRPVQQIEGVEVRLWGENFPDVVPGEIVIEAFACHLPDAFIEHMARRVPQPIWINLDYLSAEAWVSGCHALPSPHPHLPLTKYFFFPGFDETTGGLLREHNLEGLRQQFLQSSSRQSGFWQNLGFPPPATGTLTVSLFAYENPALPDLLHAWKIGDKPVCCLAPITRTQPAIEAFLGQPVQAGMTFTQGNLEIRLLPFVAQEDYDHLLWSCDLNFVRGEDSFVRAQWAEKPMVWQIYPQDEDAHRVKLEAFLDRYCAELPESSAKLLRKVFLAWNGFGVFTPELIASWMAGFREFSQHAEKWAKNQSKQQDLCTSLVRFCYSKL